MINAEAGSKDANSYISLDDANSYFNTRLNSEEWDKASETIKQKALIMATAVIDTLFFAGRKWKSGSPGAEDYQALEWPRYPNYSDPYMLGIPHLMSTAVPENEWVDQKGIPIIPQAVKNATCEQAYFLIRTIKGLDKREHLLGQGLKSISYPDINETFVDKTPVSPSAYRFLNKIKALESNTRIVRG